MYKKIIITSTISELYDLALEEGQAIDMRTTKIRNLC
jgi:hypothetical protein